MERMGEKRLVYKVYRSNMKGNKGERRKPGGPRGSRNENACSQTCLRRKYGACIGSGRGLRKQCLAAAVGKEGEGKR